MRSSSSLGMRLASVASCAAISIWNLSVSMGTGGR